MKRLVFKNADATPKMLVIETTDACVRHVMAWYAAYHDGDRYTVTFDGENLNMDQNGEPTSRRFTEPLFPGQA